MTADDISLLIIEDDKSALKICERVISRLFPALTVHTASSSVDSILKYKQYYHDIVLTDVYLPNKDAGYKMAGEICDVKPEAIVVLMTGDTS